MARDAQYYSWFFKLIQSTNMYLILHDFLKSISYFISSAWCEKYCFPEVWMCLCFRCARGVTGTLSAPSGCPSRGSLRWLASVSLATNFYLCVGLISKILSLLNVMMLLNNLLQIWIVLRCHGGPSVKAQCMCPSLSLTWTLDRMDQ